MKVDKIQSKNQPSNWLQQITHECAQEYPIHLVDILPEEQVLDIGCNVGGFSRAFSSRFYNILAVDASLYNVEQYKKIHQNEILHRAAHSVDGEVLKLRKYMGNGDDDTNSGNFSTIGFVNSENNHGWRSDEYEEVTTISLESILNKVGDVGLLKVDIEGSEFDFLYQKDLSKIKYITGEFHNFLGEETQTLLFEWIEQTHDQIFSVGNGVTNHYQKMWKRR